MRRIHVLFITLLMGVGTGYGQEFDIILTSSESGTKIHQARNSITFGPNYSYTPNGGTMTAEIVKNLVTGEVSYNSTVVDPETRSLNTSYMVGTTNGSFNVSPVGGATYTIPLDLPLGVAGLQPSISINYNSLAGSGIVGYGWQIQGLSVITRSPQTYYYDGKYVGVDLTSTDRFFLDGQRLRCTNGTYGANGSQYRTENDVFSKVTCYTDSDGPDKFEVKTKGGITCQYGYDSDADQTVDGHNETISWYINKATDVYGNTINYTYIKDNGFNYIGVISYGRNTVTFYYKERSDKRIAYLKGEELSQNLILDKIEIEYNSNVVKKYEFKYNYPTSSYTRHSILNEIIEYGIGSSRYNSTVFTYTTPDVVSFSQTEYNDTHNYISYKSKICFGDFNGDGLPDAFTVDDPDVNAGNYTGWKLFTNNGDDSFTSVGNGDFGLDESKATFTAVDLNGDGLDDLFIRLFVGKNPYPDPGTINYRYQFLYALSTGNSFSTPQTISIENYPLSTLAGVIIENSILEANQMDFDGDGLIDILIRTHSGWELYGYTYNGSCLTFGSKSADTPNLPGDYQYFIDFNGDGKSELMAVDADGTRILEYSSGSWTELYSTSIPKKDHHFELGDFNGDGKTDMFIYGYQNYEWDNWQMRLSNGTGFAINYIPKKKNNLKDDQIRVGDFNGDGCDDLMVMPTNSTWSGHCYYITKNQGKDLCSHPYSGAQISTHNYFIEDFNGDGREDYLCTDGKSPWWNGYMIYKSGSINNIQLEKVGNGLNHLTEIEYQSISECGTTYVKGTGASFPVMDFQAPFQVVKSVLSDNGRGSQNTTIYKFEGAKIHKQGKGFLCYAKQTITDVANSRSSETNYSYNTSKYFPTLTSTVNKAGSTILNSVSNTWTYKTTTGSAFFPYISSSTQTNSLTGHSITSTFTCDTYGNATEIEKSFNNGVTETTTNQYTNNATNWHIGKLNSSEVKYQKSGETTITNTVRYTYSTDGILKPDFIKYYEGTDKYFYKNHDYYGNGNLKQLYVYASGIGARQTNYIYETDGVRVQTISDPMSHITTMAYDSYGRLSSVEDYLDNTTSYTYDNMGRQLTETQADGFVTTTSYPWGLSDGPSYACYYVQQSGNDGSLIKIWHDKLGREIRSDVRGFSGAYIYTATEYNTKGQLYRVSEPSISTSPTQWNIYSYDSYGRITGITRPSGKNTSYAYSSNRVTKTTGGKSSWKKTDSQGLLTTAHDYGGDITYAYYPNGQLKTINSPGGAITSIEYDVAGNQTKLVDPSAGTILYTYDAFGNLKTQRNARNQTTTYNYHADGRVNSMSTPEGTTSYTYNGNEQLTGISSPGNVSRNYTYDSKGRVSTISETIPGQSTFSTSFTYDTKGRLSTRTHPSGIVETNNYNSYGYLASISAGGSTRYTINTMNARQQITGATYGGSLIGEFGFDSYGYPSYSKAKVGSTYRQDYRYSFTPSTGNLYSRQNYLRSKTETFTYDNLDRLTGVSGPQNLTMAYENNGNISTKSDLGPGTYTYGHATKPFAVTEINSGNQVIPSANQVATYTSFEQVSTIDEDDYHATFTYNRNNQRCKMLITDLGSAILTRWYVGSRYIKETKGSTTTEYTWIGGDAYTAPVVAEKVGSTINYYYLLRGFTGHEHLSYFNIVNMNGRLYDPLVARFLSPDNNVQLPDYTQSFNRYSYCLNNPLRFTDPNGEFITWSFSNGGFSIGFNLTPLGIPLGAGINIGWGDGLSLGGYGEVGYRVGGTGLGSGVTVSQSLDYNFNHSSWSTSTSEGAYASFGLFNAGVNFSQTYNISSKQWSNGWGVSAGVGFGNDGRGIGFNIGYGSSGFTYGMGGYYNSHAWDDNPEYNSELWNYDGCDESVIENNNCYSYAIDDPFNDIEGKPQPGDYSGNRIECISIDEITAAGIADGYIKKPNFFNKLGFGKKGYYNVYLVIDNVDGVQDYHWYRQDKGGMWSHKPGTTNATNMYGNRSIRNPARINHIPSGPYYYPNGSFAGYLHYNNGGMLLWVRR